MSNILAPLLLAELDIEAAATRKILQRVPSSHHGYRPHDKSFPLGRLASHIAELPMFLTYALTTDEMDLAQRKANPVSPESSNEELIAFYESELAEAKKALEAVQSDDYLMEPWTFRIGERIVSKASRYMTIRSWMQNHQIHHRGQLSVYLRLLDIPVPGMYGPSADDRIAMQAAAGG